MTQILDRSPIIDKVDLFVLVESDSGTRTRSDRHCTPGITGTAFCHPQQARSRFSGTRNFRLRLMVG